MLNFQHIERNSTQTPRCVSCKKRNVCNVHPTNSIEEACPSSRHLTLKETTNENPANPLMRGCSEILKD